MSAGESALAGIRVLDMSRVLAGPWATQLLADLGADVIKIERPGTGDDTRSWGPPWFEGENGSREASYYTCANRGKRSITADLSDPADLEKVVALARTCDVLVENFKVGGLARYGLDYESLSVDHSRLIYCSITGYGQDGPRKSEPGYDFIAQAMGGLMSLTGEADGPPMKAGVAITDILTGLYASNGILAALHHRERSGSGQHIDIALMDVQIAALANQAAAYLTTRENPLRQGNSHPSIVPYQSFATADGSIAVAVGNDGQFRRLCSVLGCPEIADSPSYAHNAGRVKAREQLVPILAARFMVRSRGDWLALLTQAEIPCGPVNTLSEALEEPQIVHRGMQIKMPHNALGEIYGIACPLRMSSSASIAKLGPPALGEHNGQYWNIVPQA